MSQFARASSSETETDIGSKISGKLSICGLIDVCKYLQLIIQARELRNNCDDV